MSSTALGHLTSAMAICSPHLMNRAASAESLYDPDESQARMPSTDAIEGGPIGMTIGKLSYNYVKMPL
jgi:hypothetical protein